MSQMVERVARAISVANGHDPDGPIMGSYAQGWEIEVSVARAAIAAMREPTEAMIEAGLLQFDAHCGSFDNIYETMIDAALKEAEATPNEVRTK